MTRCPGLVVAVWALMQMGLVVCGARLVTATDHADAALGVVGVLTGATLPLVCILLAWGVVSRRCYRLAQMPEAVAGRSKAVVWTRSVFLPSYQLDTTTYPVSRAFSTVVGRTRLPSCLWAGLPVIQPVVMLVVVFAEGGSCNASLVAAGVVVMVVGAVMHVYFRPHRILVANYLQGIAMALNAAILIVASQLVSNPLNVSALQANRGIAMLQVGFSGCRFAHTAGYLLYMRLWAQEVFCVCEQDGTLLLTTSADAIAKPVFDIRAGCCVSNKEIHKEGFIHHHTAPLLPVSTLTTTPAVVVACDDPIPTPTVPPGAIATTSTERPKGRDILGSANKKSQGPSYISTLLFSPKTNKKFTESIVSSIINSKNGHVPMERPYTLLWEEEVDDDDIVMPPDTRGSISDDDNDEDDLGVELDDIRSSSSSSSSGYYLPSSSSTSKSTTLSE
eukprot:TRINITY_DN14976_c0_g1_i1.p1 TRINITY_DN14976_c0_g1~~TRINITY_DN14976_c0_g1_i1.p1  ORF type:complete len:447 (-),score=32.31 TRINITY_DN14976_c0_g1_i1:250-1590(-)